MKFSSTEEYGLRCLLQMAKKGTDGTTTIVELSQKEAVTPAYIGKIMSILRKGGLVKSIRGQSGGYQLSRPPQGISVNEVLEALGGKFFQQEEHCDTPSKEHDSCVHSMDCAVRSLWMGLDLAVTGYLKRCKLSDLVSTETEMEKRLGQAPAAKQAPLAGAKREGPTP